MEDQQQPQPQEMNTVGPHDGLDLPPGFRFHPSDFEIVHYYLMNKVYGRVFTYRAFKEVNLNMIEPWDLPDQAKWGEKEWYFFYQKDCKYPTGLRTKRATGEGYWKATGRDKEVYDTTGPVMLLVGMKKTLVFYKGKAPRGVKTNWVMHEYRLEGSGRLPNPMSTSSLAANTAATMKASMSTSKHDWVVCRVFDKTVRIKKMNALAYQWGTMDDANIDQNQNNIPTIPIPMPLHLPLPMPMPMEFPIIPDIAMDLVPPYYPNDGAGMPPMVGIDGAGELQINEAVFGNLVAMPPQMNFYHQMGMCDAASQMDIGVEAAQMDMGAIGVGGFEAVGVGGFNVATQESSLPSSMVSQKDEQENAIEISSMMSMTGLAGSMTSTIEMDSIWKYKY